MCETTFTFGQRGNHFFQCPSRRDYTRLPKKLTSLLTSAQIQEVHHVALGFENSFLLTYRDKHGRDHIESHNLPPELLTFLTTTRLKIPSIRLTLGPQNTSFFISDTTSSIWQNLPPTLLTALQSRIQNGAWTDRPRLVALGADSTFLLLTEAHAAVWDLRGYGMLARMLEYARTQDRGIEEVRNVVLHAYRYGCFVAVAKNGMLVSENVPVHEGAGVDSMRAAILKDVEEVGRKKAVRAQGKTQVAQRKRESESVGGGESVGRKPGLQAQATFRREWGERKQEFRAQGKGLRLSLSLTVSAAGIAGSFGKMLG